MSFGVKRPGMVYGPRGGVTPGLFGIHIPIVDDVINTAGKLAAASGIPGVSGLGRLADAAVRDRAPAQTTTKTTTASDYLRNIGVTPIQEQSQTPFPKLPAAPGSIDVNPPFMGPPGAGVNITTNRGQLQLGVGQQSAGNGGGQMVQRGGGQLGPVSVQPIAYAETVHRCPTGWVLAIDGMCYPKSMVPRKMRKWKPRRKPPISRKKWKALLDAESAQKTAKRIAEKAGFVTRKRK